MDNTKREIIKLFNNLDHFKAMVIHGNSPEKGSITFRLTDLDGEVVVEMDILDLDDTYTEMVQDTVEEAISHIFDYCDKMGFEISEDWVHYEDIPFDEYEDDWDEEDDIYVPLDPSITTAALEDPEVWDN